MGHQQFVAVAGCLACVRQHTLLVHMCACGCVLQSFQYIVVLALVSIRIVVIQCDTACQWLLNQGLLRVHVPGQSYFVQGGWGVCSGVFCLCVCCCNQPNHTLMEAQPVRHWVHQCSSCTSDMLSNSGVTTYYHSMLGTYPAVILPIPCARQQQKQTAGNSSSC